MAKRKQRKTTKKTPDKTPGVELVPQAHGGAIKTGGNPGNKGGPGRPLKAFKQFCADVTNDPLYQENLEATAKNPESSHYIGAVKFVAEHAHGKPAQAIALSGEVTFNAAEIRQQIADRIARRTHKGGTR
jgi:hypothetical protein